MPFLSKRACTASRVLLLTDCPPHDVPHLPFEYPIYYDALYYPEFHGPVFDTPPSFLRWLSLSLKDHHRTCRSCPRFDDHGFHVDYTHEHFCINFESRSLSLSIAEVEASSFSLCHLLRRFWSMSHNPASFANTKLMMLNETPVWCYRADTDLARALNELSRPVLLDGIRLLRLDNAISKLRKDDMVRAIVRDFVHERNALLLKAETTALTSGPDCVCAHRACLISRAFHDRYGPSVAAALRNPLSESGFNAASHGNVNVQHETPNWLKMSQHDMHLLIQHLPKQTLMDCLHRIPSHVRPHYNSRSIRSCSSALADHIQHRITHLLSLSDVALLEVSFAVYPFDCTSDCTRGILTHARTPLSIHNRQRKNPLRVLNVLPGLPRTPTQWR